MQGMRKELLDLAKSGHILEHSFRFSFWPVEYLLEHASCFMA